MAETKNIEEVLGKYEISETHMDKIYGLLEAKRFKSVDSFVDQALEVFLAWEYNPSQAMVEMSKVRPTIDQYAFMITTGMNYAHLKQTYPNFPERFGDTWNEYLANHDDIDQLFQKIKSQHDPQSDARASHKDYEQAIARKTDAEHFIKTLDFSEKIENAEEFVYDGWPLLFTHYSRIFPAKVALLALAELMRSQDRKLIHFEKFTEKAFDLCEEISEKQKSREEKQKISKEHKMSVGLPSPYSKTKTDDKQQEYQNRYKEKFFGKVKRNKKDGKLYFEGLLSALGLIRIFKIDGEYNVTFSEKGKEFYMLQNPIFDREFISEAFSDEEKQYILEKLISDKLLEVQLMNSAINTINVKDDLRNKDMIEYLDEAFENTLKTYCDSNKDDFNSEKLLDMLDSTIKLKKDKIEAKKLLDTELKPTEIENYKRILKKQTSVEALRVATMGRMSELHLVKWETEGGKSSFRLGESELIEILKNLN